MGSAGNRNRAAKDNDQGAKIVAKMGRLMKKSTNSKFSNGWPSERTQRQKFA